MQAPHLNPFDPLQHTHPRYLLTCHSSTPNAYTSPAQVLPTALGMSISGGWWVRVRYLLALILPSPMKEGDRP